MARLRIRVAIDLAATGSDANLSRSPASQFGKQPVALGVFELRRLGLLGSARRKQLDDHKRTPLGWRRHTLLTRSPPVIWNSAPVTVLPCPT
jgi:hypothetical protein